MHSPSREVHQAALTAALKGTWAKQPAAPSTAAAFSHMEVKNKCLEVGLAQTHTAKHLPWHLAPVTIEGARKIIASSLKVR